MRYTFYCTLAILQKRVKQNAGKSSLENVNAHKVGSLFSLWQHAEVQQQPTCVCHPVCVYLLCLQHVRGLTECQSINILVRKEKHV